MKRILVLVTVLLLVVGLTACKTEAPEKRGPEKEASGLTPATGSTGDPPVIPHEVAEADGGAECLECHLEGEAGAKKTPHPHLVDCRQCHISLDEQVQPFKTSY